MFRLSLYLVRFSILKEHRKWIILQDKVKQIIIFFKPYFNRCFKYTFFFFNFGIVSTCYSKKPVHMTFGCMAYYISLVTIFICPASVEFVAKRFLAMGTKCGSSLKITLKAFKAMAYWVILNTLDRGFLFPDPPNMFVFLFTTRSFLAYP